MQLRNNYDRRAGCSTARSGSSPPSSLEDSELRVLLDEDEEVAYGFVSWMS